MTSRTANSVAVAKPADEKITINDVINLAMDQLWAHALGHGRSAWE